MLLGGLFKATGNQAPFVAFAGVKGKLAYDMLELRRFVARHGLTKYRMNPHFPVNTLMLMRGLVAAQAAGDGPAYVEMGLQGMWEQGLKLDDPEVLARGDRRGRPRCAETSRGLAAARRSNRGSRI